MKTRQYLESFVKQGIKTYSSMMYEVEGKQFKFTYENGNAFEHFKIEQYDGEKLNLIAVLTDLNEKRDTSAYNLLNEMQTKTRVASLNLKAQKYVESLIQL